MSKPPLFLNVLLLKLPIGAKCIRGYHSKPLLQLISLAWLFNMFNHISDVGISPARLLQVPYP